MIRRSLLASTALTTSTTLVTGAALAADLPVKAPRAPPPAPFSWTGCYVGGNAGAAWTSIDQSLTTAPPFREVLNVLIARRVHEDQIAFNGHRNFPSASARL